ncbi:protein BatD [bacterium]|nr:protein BatD [candidate division CSSED10-310 bacterium]
MRWIVVLMLLAAAGVQAAGIELNAVVDRTGLGQDEVLTWQLTLSQDGGGSMPEPELPDFSDFEVVGGPSSQTSFQMINFKTTASRIITVNLLPRRTGTLTIGPARVEVDGQVVSSRSFTITVQSRGAVAPESQEPAGTPREADDKVFLDATAGKNRVYVGEQVTVEYYLYSQLDLADVDFQTNPGTSGFWVEDLNSPQRLSLQRRTINDEVYGAALLKRLALFPTTSGTQTIDPMTVKVSVRIPRSRPQGRSSRSLFDTFFTDPFSSSPFDEIKSLFRSSPALSLEVLPLPLENRPEDFKGTVGLFRLTGKVDKTSATRGQAITYTLTLTGRGNIKTVADPPPLKADHFRVYDPRTEERSVVRDGDLLGEKTFEYVLIPREVGTLTIPAVPYWFFNPETGRYQQTVAGAVALHVTPGGEPDDDEVVMNAVDKKQVVLRTSDIQYIKSAPAGLRDQRLRGSGWLWLLVAPLVAGPAAAVIDHRRRRFAGDIGYARRRRAESVARATLKVAEKALKQGDSKGFYDALSAALVGFVSDKANRPRQACTTDVLMELLRERQVPEDAREVLRRLLGAADVARFTPAVADRRVMDEAYQEACRWLQDIIRSRSLEEEG